MNINVILDVATEERPVDTSVFITRHACKRLHERSGMNKRSMNRMARRALLAGYGLSNTRGRLNAWMNSKIENYGKGKDMRVYGDKLWVFEEGVLLTVLQIPPVMTKNLRAYCHAG